MAIPTTFRIKFTCGHTETKDLSDTPAGKRKARAFGLGKNFVCKKCFAAQGQDDLEKKNTQVLVAAQGFEEEHGLPVLEGTEKQVSWATRTRYEALTEILDADPDKLSQPAEQVIEVSKSLTRAGWWLDNTTDKELTVEDLVELITTGIDEADDDHITTENPF